MKTFEDYLKEVHDKQYRGAADDAPDDFESWFSCVGCNDFIEYGDQYKAIRMKEIDQEIKEMSKK